MTIAEDGKSHEDVTTPDKTTSSNFGSIPNAMLATLHASLKTLASGRVNIWLDQASLILADVTGRASEVARIDLDGLGNHDDGEVDNTSDSQEGGVFESGNLLLQGDGENYKNGHENENEFSTDNPVHRGRQASLEEEGKANMQFISDNNGITNTCTKTIQELQISQYTKERIPGQYLQRFPLLFRIIS